MDEKSTFIEIDTVEQTHKRTAFLHQKKKKESSIFILNAIGTSENTETLTKKKKKLKNLRFFVVDFKFKLA